MTPDLSVISDPELTTDVDKSTPTIPGLSPACAVTRAAARRAALQTSDTTKFDVTSSSQQVSGGVMSSDTGDGEVLMMTL